MIKLVLKPTSAEMDVRLIAQIHGWPFLGEVPAGPSNPRQIVWAAEDATEITYVEDTVLRQPYLVISGSREESVAERLQNGLEIYDPTQVVQVPLANLGADEASRLVNAAALMAPVEFNIPFYEFFGGALQHPSAEVRRAAIFAITYVPWKQFRDLLLTIKTRDTALSRDIEIVVQSIDVHGWH